MCEWAAGVGLRRRRTAAIASDRFCYILHRFATLLEAWRGEECLRLLHDGITEVGFL